MKHNWRTGVAALLFSGFVVLSPADIPSAEAKPLDWLKSKISKSESKEEETAKEVSEEADSSQASIQPTEKPEAKTETVVEAKEEKKQKKGFSLFGSKKKKKNEDVATLGLAEPKFALMGAVHIPSTKPAPPPPSMYEIAAEYENFKAAMDDLSKKTPRTTREVRAAYKQMAAYDPQDLAWGMATKAAKDVAARPDFKEELSERFGEMNREEISSTISKKRNGTLTKLGSRNIKADIEQAILDEITLMHRLGEQMKQAAYQVNKASTASAATLPQVGMKKAVPTKGMKPMVNRIVTLAARMSLGAAEGDQRKASELLAANDNMLQCFNWAKLNLSQCKSAARGPEELAYCTGKHGLEDRASCWSWVAFYGEGA